MIDAYEIEAALEALFTAETSEMKFKAIDVQREITSLTRPGLAWAVTGGKYTVENGMAENVYERFEIVGLIAIKNVAKEKERRKVAHACRRYVTLKLLGETLGLDIEKIEPASWREITTADNMSTGLLVMQMNFTTSALVQADSGDAEKRLTSILTSIVDDDGQTLVDSNEDFEGDDA